ncbi:hypothetical protein [Bradyrhizobium sp.]|uniref:hypothetical protein n=1 Tax=Bradyrhizobium sp. TaxID=376 RepID=UPI004037F377
MLKGAGDDSDERRSERLKLVANWANTIATAVITVGTFVPLGQFVFGILPKDVDLDLVYGAAPLCLGAGVIIHLGGQWTLGGLR